MKYSFNSPESIIKDVEVFSVGKEKEALVYMPAEASTEQLEQVQRKLEQSRYGVQLGTEGADTVLRVYGFGSASNLLATMADNGATVGDYSTAETARDTQIEIKDDNANKRAIKTVAGIGYSVGNLSTVAAGVKRGMATGKWAEAMQGAAWTLPGFGLIIDGLQTADSQMPFLYDDLNNFLKENDVRVPSNIQGLLDERKSDNNLWDKTKRFATGNSSATFAAAEFTGALLGSYSGFFQQDNAYKGIGTTIMGIGMLAGAIIPEEHVENKHSALLGNHVAANNIVDFNRPTTQPQSTQTSVQTAVPEQQEADGNPLDRFSNWLKERPMRIAGLAANVQNVIKFIGTAEVDERRRMNFDGVPSNPDATEAEKLAAVNDPNAWKTAKQGFFGKESATPIVGEYYTKKVKLQTEQEAAVEALKGLDKSADGYDTAIENVAKSDNKLKALDSERHEFKISDDAVLFDKLAIYSFVGANLLTMLTDKDNSPDLIKSGGVNNVMEMCANIIIEQPADAQKAMTQRLATFLANHDYVKLNIDEVVTQLSEKVDILGQSKWVKAEIAATKDEPDNKLESDRQSLERLYANGVQTPAMAIA